MKWHLILAGMLFLPASGNASEDGREWYSSPPPKVLAAERTALPPNDIYEVVLSKQAFAVWSGLSTKPILAISEDLARQLTGPYYRCDTGKKPFLARGVFINGGTGGFEAFKVGQAIWIMHEGLGSMGGMFKSALIVNLAFDPTEAYVTASTAQ